VLSGQFRPRSGIVRFKGQDIYERNLETKREIGYVHEEPFLYPHLTAEEHLTCIARMKKIRPAESGRQIPDLLDAFGLIEVRRKLTARLSLGMRKKLALASAMLGDPQILFLDEALSGLDVEGLHRVKTTLKEFTERGGTVLLSSHNLDLMEKLCGRYALLRRGRLIADLDRRAIQSDLESRVLALLAEFPNAIDFKGPD
ncbi:MAG TPA: ABC transporter ATP-binding protein, partial [bacterium]